MKILKAWIEVIAHPLGLSGFSLFLVFLVLSKIAPNNQKRWLTPTFVLLALIALIGGLFSAYADLGPMQESSGQCSPNMLFNFGIFDVC